MFCLIYWLYRSSLSLNLEFQLQYTFSHFFFPWAAFWCCPKRGFHKFLHFELLIFQKIHIRNVKAIFSFKKLKILWQADENNATCSVYLDLKKKMQRKNVSVNRLLSLRKYVVVVFFSRLHSLFDFLHIKWWVLLGHLLCINKPFSYAFLTGHLSIVINISRSFLPTLNLVFSW